MSNQAQTVQQETLSERQRQVRSNLARVDVNSSREEKLEVQRDLNRYLQATKQSERLELTGEFDDKTLKLIARIEKENGVDKRGNIVAAGSAGDIMIREEERGEKPVFGIRVARVIDAALGRAFTDEDRRAFETGVGRPSTSVTASYRNFNFPPVDFTGTAVQPKPFSFTFLSEELQSWIRESSERHKVDPNLVASIMHVESRGNPTALSPRGAYGRMQLMPATAAALNVDRYDERQNIEGGVKLLAELERKFNGNRVLMAAAYNAGEPAVRRHNGVPPFAETQAYVKDVARTYVQATSGTAGQTTTNEE